MEFLRKTGYQKMLENKYFNTQTVSVDAATDLHECCENVVVQTFK